jgi:nucleotide-binding universal stress UspA family protein
MLTRILVPLDGSALAEKILPEVIELAGLRGAEVLLLRVVHAHTFPGTDPVEAQVQAVDEAQAYLARLEARLVSHGLSVRTAVRYGHAAEEILDHAKASDATLLAMSTHGRSGLRRFMLGSVAEAVVRHAPIPVLLIRGVAPAALHADDPVPPPHQPTHRPDPRPVGEEGGAPCASKGG